MAFPAMVDATMITRVRYLLNEPVPMKFTDAQLHTWFDRGTNIILAKTKCGEVGGTTFYYFEYRDVYLRYSGHGGIDGYRH